MFPAHTCVSKGVTLTQEVWQRWLGPPRLMQGRQRHPQIRSEFSSPSVMGEAPPSLGPRKDS